MAYNNLLPAPFVVNPRLTAIAISYENAASIADEVLPRVPVETPDFAYTVFNKADNFTVADSKVDRKSEVNQVDWSGTQATASVEDQALDEVVPRRDQAVATAYGSPIDSKAKAVDQISKQLDLGREKRAAALVFSPTSYAAANTTTLTGTGQWSDFTNSDPLAALMAAIDSMIVMPNQLVLGRAASSVLRRHPKIVASYFGNAGQYGLVPLQFLADQLGLEKVLVGSAWINGAKRGQPVTLNRMWGKSAALLYTNPNPDVNTPSFGITAQWGPKLTGEYFDFKLGMRGSDIVRVGESVKETVLANDLGYLFQNAVA